jgi:hypothetical protein
MAIKSTPSGAIMSQSSAVSANPQLSPSFDRARRVSRILAVLLAIGFWVTLAWLIALPGLLIWPVGGGWGTITGVTVNPAALPVGDRAGVIFAIILGTAPSLLILHHATRAFVQFAKGEVFVSTAIAHIRSAGLWLIIAGFGTAVEHLLFHLFAAVRPIADEVQLRPALIFVGLSVYVMAYVMAEAQRIAADNASIV